MAERVIHISETEATSNFADLLAYVRAGAEVVSRAAHCLWSWFVSAEPHVRLLSESLRLVKVHASTVTLDGELPTIQKQLSRATPRTGHAADMGLMLDSNLSSISGAAFSGRRGPV